MPYNPSAFLAQLREARDSYHLPARLHETVRDWMRSVLSLLFPHAAPIGASHDAAGILREYDSVASTLQEVLRELLPDRDQASAIADALMAALPDIRIRLYADAEAIHRMDPAAQSIDEVFLAYPGFLATICHRVAQPLWQHGVPIMPRLITEWAHERTGVDLHPGATIGERFAIDHGTGIVVGETARIGNDVRLYQGVTLGALRVAKALANVQRHPTIEDDVTVYANATILGGRTVIGRGSVIGGNVWLTHSVPPGSIVTHAVPDERLREDYPLEFEI
ncbi:MAG: serine O-acetyltransferase EpsC [Gemmatimonadaceae bacterium]|nr:serine O-acetyltransferase EpsC [Gemmatimonadaceae bacterium]